MRYKTSRYKKDLELLENEFQKKIMRKAKVKSEMRIIEKFRYILRLFSSD